MDGVEASALDQSGHVVDTGNPHGVSTAQIGAATPADVTTEVNSGIATHSAVPNAHHVKTTSFSELSGQASDGQIPANIARDSEAVAEAASQIAIHSAQPSAHHSKTSDFAELSGQASDGQIPESIARDSEILPTVLANDGAGSDLDADRVDGLQASQFLRSDASDSTSGTLTVTGDLRTSSDFEYTSPRTYYHNVPGNAFLLRDSAEEDEWFRSLNGYGYVPAIPDSDANVQLVAPVELPQGATTNEFRCYYMDDSATVNLSFDIDLYRRNLASSTAALMADLQRSAASTDSSSIISMADTSITSPVVNNENYAYYIALVWDPQGGAEATSEVRFYGCRVRYTMNTVAP